MKSIVEPIFPERRCWWQLLLNSAIFLSTATKLSTFVMMGMQIFLLFAIRGKIGVYTVLNNPSGTTFQRCRFSEVNWSLGCREYRSTPLFVLCCC